MRSLAVTKVTSKLADKRMKMCIIEAGRLEYYLELLINWVIMNVSLL